ncbi:hypothetical protein GGS21DRAFT_519418 [Xylaria nigripes]|nr:hypothetical protein GGS21DRAFT_519418 [Xylaria nigripes]
MNTIKSFWLGWGALFAAGGGAYYFAKQSINADRTQRFQEAQRKKRMMSSFNEPNSVPVSTTVSPNSDTPASSDPTGSPSREASSDPAPTQHAPTTENQRVFEKSKYESSTPFKSPKGDRFS